MLGIVAMTTPASTRSAIVASLAVALSACGGAAASGEGAASGGGDPHALIGNPAPDFSASSVNGKGKASVRASSGKVLIVDFWATWCDPCKKSFPKLQGLYAKLKPSGMDLIAISEDDENSGIQEFGNNYGAKFPLVWDDGKKIAGKWVPKSMPTTFIVDKSGVVRFVHFGYHDGEELEIEKEVKSLL
jgi:peroxiredoxin